MDHCLKTHGPDAVNIPCPLVPSAHTLAQQQDGLARWGKEIERKAQVLREIGAYTGWDGAVSPDEFGVVAGRLEGARERFLRVESRTSEEREG